MSKKPPYEIWFYEKTDGVCPVISFLDEIREVKIRAKVMKWIEKLEEHVEKVSR
ncbi:hypothetical protein ACFL5X_03585 [Candidatus Omnitrophota bacterium]